MHKRSSIKIKNLSQTAKVVGLLLLVGGFLVAVILSQTIQEIRQQADVVKGSSSIKLVPGSSSLVVGQQTQVQLIANIQQGIQIDGIQVIGEFSGNIPANITFTPNRPTGFNQDANDSIARLVTSGANKKLELIYITPRSTVPYTTTGQNLLLGTFTFTPSATGQMAFTFNASLTKVLQTGSSTNLFGTGTSATVNSYQFVTATPTPNATRTPTPSPSFTPSPTPSKTPTPTPGTGGNSPTPSPTKTPTPSPSFSPTPTPTRTPTPSPSFSPTPTPTRTPTPSPSFTATPRPTNSSTPTPVATATSTPIPTTVATATPVSTVCEGDINGDLIVEISDYSILVRNFLKEPVPEPQADLNKDTYVDIGDYSILARNFLRDCRNQ